ncbi:MAG: peptidylprolyl isomerase [Holosporales bacterium]|nr:peptidylprolyl isomerase [Holosporales bacterium]
MLTLESFFHKKAFTSKLLFLPFLYGIFLGGVTEKAIADTPSVSEKSATLSLKKENQTADNRVAFLVNGEAVFTKTLEDRIRFTALTLGMAASPDILSKLRTSVIQNLTNEILQRQMATKMDLKIDEKSVEEAWTSLEKDNQMKPGDLKQFFKANGLSENILKNQIRSNLLWMDYIRKRYEYGLTVAPQEIDIFLNRFENKKNTALYNIAEIVLYVSDAQNDTNIKRQAQQIVEWIKNGTPFQKLAHQFSQSASKNQGGYLGWVSENDLEEPLLKALHQMAPGMLSLPIRTASGYVILAFVGRKDPSPETVPTPHRSQVMAILKSEHLERLARRELTALQKKMTLEIRE